MATFKPQFGRASVTISGDLIGHVRKLYWSALEDVVRRYPDREAVIRVTFRRRDSTSLPRLPFHGLHDETSAAVPAYILAVTAVEAFLNEAFLSDLAGHLTGHVMSEAARKRLEALRLETKLIVVPLCVFGRTLARGVWPYQDMRMLIKLRNELVHYKMGQKPPKLVRILAQRGFAISVPPEQEDGGIVPWANRVSTSEGIRWAHNTACDIVGAVLDLAPPDSLKTWFVPRFNFSRITDEEARGRLLEAAQAHEVAGRELAEPPEDGPHTSP